MGLLNEQCKVGPISARHLFCRCWNFLSVMGNKFWKKSQVDEILCTEKSRFNASQFNKTSWFRVQNVVTKIEFLIKKSRFSINSRLKESKRANVGHSLNRDFTVLCALEQCTQVDWKTRATSFLLLLILLLLVSSCQSFISWLMLSGFNKCWA